jgi:hypothetical protein
VAESFDVVEGNACGACSLQDLGYCIAALSASYGPSEGLRPPQDDISGVIGRDRWAHFAFRISVSKSGFESSRTRWGYFSPPW